MSVVQADELDPIAQQVDSWFERNFSRNLTPDFLMQLRRFITKGARFATSSTLVGTTAVLLVDRDPQRIEVLIYNNGAAPIFIGNRKVTAAAGDPNGGIPIQPQTGLVISSTTAQIWAVSGSSGMDARVMDSAGNL